MTAAPPAIRRATASDQAAIVAVHLATFSTDIEADLVAALLFDPAAQPAESWVAEVGSGVVGHVLCTPGVVATDASLPVLLLCPLAVLPAHQHSGLGSGLTRSAIASAREAGVRAISVFGDPDYYSRFGFQPLLPDGPLPPFDVAPQERAWQTLLLSDTAPTVRAALSGAHITWAKPLMAPALWQA